MQREVLPRREWIAKFTPDALDTYLSDSDSDSKLRRSNTVWSDSFDNIIGPFSPSHDQTPSRRILCKAQAQAAQFNQSQSLASVSSSLFRGPRPAHQLFADDCFVEGIVEGFGIVILAATIIASVSILAWLFRRQMKLLRSPRRRPANTSASNCLLDGTSRECPEKRSKAREVMNLV